MAHANYADEYYGDSAEHCECASDPCAAQSSIDVEAGADEPLSITIDGVSVTQRSSNDRIAADRHIAANRAASHNTFGMSIRKVNPGGAVRL